MTNIIKFLIFLNLLLSFSFADSKNICNYIENSNYWCGIGSTPDQAFQLLV